MHWGRPGQPPRSSGGGTGRQALWPWWERTGRGRHGREEPSPRAAGVHPGRKWDGGGSGPWESQAGPTWRRAQRRGRSPRNSSPNPRGFISAIAVPSSISRPPPHSPSRALAEPRLTPTSTLDRASGPRHLSTCCPPSTVHLPPPLPPTKVGVSLHPSAKCWAPPRASRIHPVRGSGSSSRSSVGSQQWGLGGAGLAAPHHGLGPICRGIHSSLSCLAPAFLGCRGSCRQDLLTLCLRTRGTGCYLSSSCPGDAASQAPRRMSLGKEEHSSEIWVPCLENEKITETSSLSLPDNN